MIDKIYTSLADVPPGGYEVQSLTLELVASKLDEVIEAVNKIQQYLNWSSPQQPPFPPVLSPDELRRS